MSDISNRNNIVNYFYNNLHTAKLSTTSNSDKTVVVLDDGKAKITKTEDFITFEMKLSGTKVDEYEDYHHQRKVKSHESFSGLVKVMQFNVKTSSFDMVSCSHTDNWLDVHYVMQQVYDEKTMLHKAERVQSLTTNLNSHYYRLPSTEEEHFQRMSTDGLILDLEVCQRLYNIIERLNGFGEIVKANDNLYVNLFFEQNLRKGG